MISQREIVCKVLKSNWLSANTCKIITAGSSLNTFWNHMNTHLSISQCGPQYLFWYIYISEIRYFLPKCSIPKSHPINVGRHPINVKSILHQCRINILKQLVLLRNGNGIALIYCWLATGSIDGCYHGEAWTKWLTYMIAKFMGPTWGHLGPTGPRLSHVGPMNLDIWDVIDVTSKYILSKDFFLFKFEFQ